MSSLKSRPIKPDEAVDCRVLAPFLIFDQLVGAQVGAGAIVKVHPRAVDSWMRNGWIERVEDAETYDEPKPTRRRKAPISA